MKKPKPFFSRSFETMFLLSSPLVILKVTETVDWSWWWVTCPLWIIPVTYLGMIAMVLIVNLIIILIPSK